MICQNIAIPLYSRLLSVAGFKRKKITRAGGIFLAPHVQEDNKVKIESLGPRMERVLRVH